MGLFDSFKKRTNLSTVSSDSDPMVEMLKAVMLDIQKTGLSVDVLPNSFGEFGLTSTNPIPTFFTLGSDEYLIKLRTLDGKSIKFERFGSVRPENLPKTPVDGYKITTISGLSLPNLYFCMYHKRNSKKAPKGFYLIE